MTSWARPGSRRQVIWSQQREPLYFLAVPSFLRKAYNSTVWELPSHHLPHFPLRLGGESRLRRRGSGRKDVVLLRLTWRTGPRPLRAVSAGLHGGDPGGAAVRRPVEALPWHRHGDDHHQGGQVGRTHKARTRTAAGSRSDRLRVALRQTHGAHRLYANCVTGDLRTFTRSDYFSMTLCDNNKTGKKKKF